LTLSSSVVNLYLLYEPFIYSILVYVDNKIKLINGMNIQIVKIILLNEPVSIVSNTKNRLGSLIVSNLL